jgi:hypothetical protein
MSPSVAATPVNVATAAVTMIVVFAFGRRLGSGSNVLFVNVAGRELVTACASGEEIF